MITSSYASMKGTSGVGKGSRVNQLLHFLRVGKGYDIKIVTMKEIDNGRAYGGAWRNHPVGMYCKELNILSLSKYTKSPKSGLYSLTGLDAVDFDTSVELIKLLGNFNLIEESYVGGFSDAFSPNKLPQFSNFFYLGLTYDKFEELFERVNQRSGPPPESTKEGRIRGDSAWGSNSLAKDFIKAVKVSSRIQDINLFAEDCRFDIPIYEFGYKYLNWLGYTELAEEFSEWSKTNTVNRDYKDVESNHLQFKELHDIQNESCKLPNQPAHFIRNISKGIVIKRGKESEGDIVSVSVGELTV